MEKTRGRSFPMMNLEILQPKYYHNLFYTEETEWMKFYHDEGSELLSWAETFSEFKQFETEYSLKYRSTPLHHAIKMNNIAIFKTMLLKGADINRPDFFLCPPLYFAILNDRDEMIKVLLNHGAKATDNLTLNCVEFSYFQKVIKFSSKDIVKLFMKNGCDVNHVFTTDHWDCPKFSRPLHIAVLNERLEIIELLLNCNANVNDVNDLGATPLHIACQMNFLEAVDLLVRNNALVNVFSKENITPLCEAIRKSNNRIVELLLSYGAFIDFDIPAVDHWTYTAICNAISAGSINILKFLLSHGLDINGNWEFFGNKILFLHTAVSHNQIEMVHLFLKYNVNIYVQDNLGLTPLHIAVKNENLQLIQLLLQSDEKLQVSPEMSTLNCLEKCGFTPLHLACTKTDLNCVQYLLECGANVNAESHEGVNPIHLACKSGDFDIVKLLIRHNATVNVATDDKSTPLHIAVENKYGRIVELLLVNGANVASPDKNNIIPLEIAVQQLYLPVIKLLLKYSKDVNNRVYRKLFVDCLGVKKENGNQIIDSFFKHGFVLSSNEYHNQNILSNAVKNGYINIVQYFLSKGVDAKTEINNESLLHCAAKNEQMQIVLLLLINGADMYAKDSFNRMPISYSILHNDKKSVELFLNRGFNMREHSSLLHYAIQVHKHLCIDFVELFIRHGADINYMSDEGNALHVLIHTLIISIHPRFNNATEYIQACTYFLEKGINVNAKRKDGLTPLQMVVKALNLDRLLLVLLQYGADPNLKGSGTEAPLRSILCRDTSYVDMLLNYGADVNEPNEEGSMLLDVLFVHTKAVIQCLRMTHVHPEETSLLQRTDFCISGLYSVSNHILKLNAANLYLSNQNKKYITYLHSTRKVTAYEEEVAELRRLMINDISAFDLLKKPIHVITRYVKYEKMQRLRESLKANLYCHYGPMILVRLEAAFSRSSLLSKTEKFLYNITCKYRLPDECTESIINYLSNNDLRYLSNFLVSSGIEE